MSSSQHAPLSVSPETGRRPRIAYLCFHVAGRDVELPVFRRLGFEIFTMKVFDTSLHRSGAVGFEDDSSLTIPKDALDYLNTVNFIDDESWSAAAVHYLNLHFDYVFIIQNHRVILNALRFFKGGIMIRLAGLDAPNSYTNYWNEQPLVFPLLRQLKDRIWFSIQYPNLPDVEDPLIRERAVYMPLGIPSYFKKYKNTWIGNEPKIVSVIPWIHTPYYRKKYNYAKAVFQDTRLVVLGGQPQNPVKDPDVTGFLDMEAYVKHFQTARALFYDSQEPRHVHYPPFEAVIVGLPVLFAKSSLLHSLGRPPMAGAYSSVEELRAKAKRLYDGDQDFVNEVLTSQASLIETFADDFVDAHWREAWSNILTARATPAPASSHTPRQYDRAVLSGNSLTSLHTTERGDGKTRFNLGAYDFGGTETETLAFIDIIESSRSGLQDTGASFTLQIGQKMGHLVSTSVQQTNTIRTHRQIWCFEMADDDTDRGTGAPTPIWLDATAPSGTDFSLTNISVLRGLLPNNRPISFHADKNRSYILSKGLSCWNPSGFDLLGRQAELYFGVSDDALGTSAPILRIGADRHDIADLSRYKLSLKLNDHPLDEIPLAECRGVLEYNISGHIQKVNHLELRLTGPDIPDDLVSAHINMLQITSA
jgi:hypothetical protein